MRSDVLSFEGFSAALAAELCLQPEQLRLDSRLVEDLGLDSLGHYQLLALVEDLADADISDATVDSRWTHLGASAETLGDMFDGYRILAGRHRGSR